MGKKKKETKTENYNPKGKYLVFFSYIFSIVGLAMYICCMLLPIIFEEMGNVGDSEKRFVEIFSFFTIIVGPILGLISIIVGSIGLMQVIKGKIEKNKMIFIIAIILGILLVILIVALYLSILSASVSSQYG